MMERHEKQLPIDGFPKGPATDSAAFETPQPDVPTFDVARSQRSRVAPSEVSLITARREVDDLLPEWTNVFHASGVPNPFAHPVWLMTWFDHYACDAQPYFVTVREEGQLVAVAPFYLEQHRLIPGLPAVTRAQLLGVTTRTHHITEIPQILAASKNPRKHVRTIVAYLGGRSQDWDWLQLTVAPEQTCFEPDWVVDPPFDGYVLETATRPAVVLPLPESWEELRASLKPKKREDIRRGFNLLSRDGHHWELVDHAATSEQLQDQLRQLRALSQVRADADANIRDSPVASTTDINQRFLEDAACRLFESQLLQPCFLKVDGTVGAGRLVLRANQSIFFSFSGFDPRWSEYGLAATLMAEILRASIKRGDKLANLSFFPNTVKLRWSEQLAFHHDVILVGTRRRSRIAFRLWWQRRALRAVQGAAMWARARKRMQPSQNAPGSSAIS